MSKNKPSAKPKTTAGDIAPGASAAQTVAGNTTMTTTRPAPHAATATPAAPTPAVTDSALHPDAAALGAPHAPLAPADPLATFVSLVQLSTTPSLTGTACAPSSGLRAANSIAKAVKIPKPGTSLAGYWSKSTKLKPG